MKTLLLFFDVLLIFHNSKVIYNINNFKEIIKIEIYIMIKLYFLTL